MAKAPLTVPIIIICRVEIMAPVVAVPFGAPRTVAGEIEEEEAFLDSDMMARY
jgi:hypothetical protein